VAKAYKTNYFDPLGKSQTGYIIDGKTYKDPEGKVRVEKGSVVETAAGNYVLTNAGGVKTDYGEASLKNATDYINKMKEDSVKKNEAGYKSGEAQINARKRQAINTYNKEARNEYLKTMESQKNMAQLLKAQGLTGGMSESRILQNKLSYENAVNLLKEKLNDNLFDLDNELLKLRNETDYNIAEESSEWDKLYLQYVSDYYEDFADRIESENRINADNYRALYLEEKEDERFNEEMEFEREKFDHEVMDDERNFNQKVMDDERNYNQKVMNDNRNYNLGVLRANKQSSGDSEYERKLKEAEIRAKYGDVTVLAEIFGWTKEQIDDAEAIVDEKLH